MRTWVTHHRRVVVGAVALAVFVVIPFIGLHVAWILPGTLDIVNSTGTLEVLALCFMFAGMAVGYDLMFGYTGSHVARSRAVFRNRRLRL